MVIVALSILLVIGLWGVFRTQSEGAEESKRRRKNILAIAAPLLIFSIVSFWTLATGNVARERFKSAIANSSQVITIEGPVTEVTRVMMAPQATTQMHRNGYWLYESIRVGGDEFRLGLGTANPGFRHYDFASPPIVEGDYIRIRHYHGRAISIEKGC